MIQFRKWVRRKNAFHEILGNTMQQEFEPTRRTFLRSAGFCGAASAVTGLLSVSPFAHSQEASPATTRVVDFHQSYLRWTLDTKLKPPKTVSKPLPMTLNRVRMPIEALVIFKNKSSGEVQRYALGAECRSEQVWVKRDIWHDPNASMCLIGGVQQCLIEKHWARADFEANLHPPKLGRQPERQLIDPQEAFAAFSIDVAQVAAVELDNTKAILETLSGNATIVARTEYRAAGFEITLEYPVKTANFSEREGYYQVDTGPMLFPVFPEKPNDGDSLLAACRLAYVAHNAPDWAEFIVCVPTPVQGDLKVHHYSKSVRVEGVRNRLFRVV
jgi:hypothetical protein